MINHIEVYGRVPDMPERTDIIIYVRVNRFRQWAELGTYGTSGPLLLSAADCQELGEYLLSCARRIREEGSLVVLT